MKFSEKLKAVRKEKKITQGELSKLAHISRKTLTNYETGITYPKSQDTYYKLAQALGVEEEDLRDDDDQFIAEARKRYGYRGKKQAMQLLEEMGGLFAGGEMTEEDIDGVMKAMQDLYWKAKEDNKKYTPNKYKK